MKILFQIILFFGLVSAKAFTPLGNPTIETLEVSGKGREYVVLKDTAIEYQIEGPKTISLISRKPIPKKHNEKLIEYSYKVKLDDTEWVHIDKFVAGKDTYIKSKKHPGHNYSLYSRFHISIPKGKHILTIDSDDEPILFRLVKIKRPKRMKSDIILEDLAENPQLNVTTGKKSIPYSKISFNEYVGYKLDFKHQIEFYYASIWFYIRAIHENDEPGLFPVLLNYQSTGSYRHTKILLYSEISQESSIEDSSLFVGKLRTIHDFNINLSSVATHIPSIFITNLTENTDIIVRGELVPNKLPPNKNE